MRHAMQVTKEAVEDARQVFRGGTPTHSDLRDRVIAIVTITLIVDLIASVAILMCERHAPGTEITNFGDSIFWVTTQLLTVSSQLHNPISTAGRAIDIVLQAIAISVVASLAGSFASFFHRRSREKHGPAEKQPNG